MSSFVKFEFLISIYKHRRSRNTSVWIQILYYQIFNWSHAKTCYNSGPILFRIYDVLYDSPSFREKKINSLHWVMHNILKCLLLWLCHSIWRINLNNTLTVCTEAKRVFNNQSPYFFFFFFFCWWHSGERVHVSTHGRKLRTHSIIIHLLR